MVPEVNNNTDAGVALTATPLLTDGGAAGGGGRYTKEEATFPPPQATGWEVSAGDQNGTAGHNTSSLVDWLSSSLGLNYTISPTGSADANGNGDAESDAAGGSATLWSQLFNVTTNNSSSSSVSPNLYQPIPETQTRTASDVSPRLVGVPGLPGGEGGGGGTLGLGIPLETSHGNGKSVIPDGAVFLPEVGYVQPPKHNHTGFLPRPVFHELGDDLWESLSPQVASLDNISKVAAVHLLNNNNSSSTNSTAGFWGGGGGDASLVSTSGDLLLDNATAHSMPTGYLSGYSPEHVVLTSVFVTLLMIIIIVGNGLVVLAICIDRNLKAVQNWFIASLALSDLLVGLLIMPFSLANELMGYWYFGNILCELWLATDVLLCTASIMNLCLISLDRFWSITRAISYVKQRTKKRAILMITLVWILSMIICFPPLVGWKRPQPMKYNKPLCVLSEDIGYVVYSTLGSFYIPLIVMVVVYLKIYFAARSRARRGLKKAAKQQQPVVNNGKSKSTMTNTTTSFSTPTHDKLCKANSMIVDREFSSFDEQCEEALKEECEGHASPTSEREDIHKDNTLHEQSLRLQVPHKGMQQLHPLDEKKKLLSDDTDSACESPVKRLSKKLPSKDIHFSEDTDSTSDAPGGHHVSGHFNGYQHHGPRSGSSNEENMKPLLEDSQLESDSQREADSSKLVAPAQQNNNLDVGVANKAEAVQLTPGDEVGEDLSSGPDGSSGGLNNDAMATSGGNNLRKPIVLTPAAFSRLNLQMRKNKLDSREKHKRLVDDPEKHKRRIARAKERRAFIVLGIIMATFILCWLPFFSTYLISSMTGAQVPGLVFAVFFWAGYCNSALNPVTYTIFNRDFRQAFSKILFGRRSWS